MKQLTISPRLLVHQIENIERNLNISLPKYYRDFMEKYSGLGVIENKFYDPNGRIYEISMFCDYKTIYEYSAIFKQENFGIKIPVAFDNGAWLYCLSLDQEDHGAIYLHNVDWTDKNDAFDKVAAGFEEFINGLRIQEV